MLKKICLDNLSHVYVQKYVKKIDKGYINAITDLDFLVDENCKYSNFLGDLIVQLESIEQISYEKIDEIMNLIPNEKKTSFDKEFLLLLISQFAIHS